MAYIEGEVPTVVQGNGGYGNNGGFFGNDGIWAVLLFALIFNRGWGNNGGYSGGYDGHGVYDINANTNRGFDNLALNSGIDSLQTAVSNGFANAEIARCNATTNILQTLNANTNALNSTLSNGFFDMAMANQKCCCEQKLATANLQSTIVQENCADRQALNEGIRDVIASNTANTQAILDKLCQQEIDAKNDIIANLRSQLNMADLRASQTAQTAQILAGQNAEVDALYNRLSNCPVPSTPVYGRQPIFTCNGNNGCGCNGLNIQ